ncbi:MAG: LolA family protein [Terriglobales bacterium]
MALAALALGLSAQQVPIAELVATLNGRYNSMQSWQANFTQIYTLGLATRTEQGHLYLEKPGRMRWNYTQPQAKQFVVSGRNVWQYTAGDAEARLTTIQNDADLRTPLRFLLGHTDLAKELDGLSYSGLEPLHPGDVVIHGRPHAAESAGWREVWIEVTPAYEIDRLLITGLDGAHNDIQLSHIQPNAKLPGHLFEFEPPPGVRVVPG